VTSGCSTRPRRRSRSEGSHTGAAYTTLCQEAPPPIGRGRRRGRPSGQWSIQEASRRTDSPHYDDHIGEGDSKVDDPPPLTLGARASYARCAKSSCVPRSNVSWPPERNRAAFLGDIGEEAADLKPLPSDVRVVAAIGMHARLLGHAPSASEVSGVSTRSGEWGRLAGAVTTPRGCHWRRPSSALRPVFPGPPVFCPPARRREALR
jgi:hypothetical protein